MTLSTNEPEFATSAEARPIHPANYAAPRRIQAYRHLAEITTREQWDHLRKDWRDRFGKFPPAVDNLFVLTEIKLAAAKAGVTRVEVREGKLMLTRRGDFILVGGKFPRISTDRIDRQLAEVLALIKNIEPMIRRFYCCCLAVCPSAFAALPGALAAGARSLTASRQS
jgi:hypothetical protein